MAVGTFTQPRDEHFDEWAADGALEFDDGASTWKVSIEANGEQTPWFEFTTTSDVDPAAVIECVTAALDGATPENTPDLGVALAEGLDGDLGVVADVPDVPVDRAGAVLVDGPATVRMDLPYDATVPA